MANAARVVLVPADLALVFTAERGWHIEEVPPAEWWQEQVRLTDLD